VVGVGHLGQSHARILSTLPGVQLVGVADIRAEQLRAVAARHGCAAFLDYHDLIDRVDAISIAVPTTYHHEVASTFLDRGIPAMVEKPLATSLAEAEQLVSLAAARGALLQVGHIERFNPALAALENLRLRPKFITAERQSTYTFRSTDIGVVLDLMIHDLDLILSLVSAPVVAVEAVGVSVFGAHEDVANARITFEDGCVATLTASRASMSAARKLRIWSAEGYVALDLMAKNATIIRPSDRLRRGELDLDGVDLTQPAAVKAHLFGKVLRVDQVPGPECDQLTLELDDFVRSIRTGSRPRVNGDDALRAMSLADQILRSLNTHAWEGTSDSPTGPFNLPEPLPEPIPGLTGPKSWRYRSGRIEAPPSSSS
jgi:predicted dehydrogenase